MQLHGMIYYNSYCAKEHHKICTWIQLQTCFASPLLNRDMSVDRVKYTKVNA
jgi:hypothetical protein